MIISILAWSDSIQWDLNWLASISSISLGFELVRIWFNWDWFKTDSFRFNWNSFELAQVKLLQFRLIRLKLIPIVLEPFGIVLPDLVGIASVQFDSRRLKPNRSCPTDFKFIQIHYSQPKSVQIYSNRYGLASFACNLRWCESIRICLTSFRYTSIQIDSIGFGAI